MTQFDHHSEDFAQNWREIYASMRNECPVAHSDQHGGFYVLTRYDDAKRVLRESDTFVCGRDLTFGDTVVKGGVTVPTNPVRMGMMEMDPPQSQAYRQVLAPWLSRKAVERYRPRMQEIVSWIVDRVIEAGQIDFVDDIANPLPAMVSLDYFGLSLEKWSDYATILHKAVYREPGSARDLAGLLDDLRATVKARRATAHTPATNLTEALLNAEVEGVPIDDETVTEMVFMLLNGGVDTSTALIASMFLYLDEHPDERARLQADPGLIPAAIDEMLRYFTPGPGVARTVARPVDINGQHLEPGDRVWLALGSANADPATFTDPERINFDRDRGSTHLAFGFGMHRCLGAFLAPVEIAILLEEVLRRLPDYRIDRERVRHYPTIPLVNGYLAMPATFTPGPRVLSGYAEALPIRLEPEVVGRG
ncbi:cytochrome P450 [Mycobacterium senriense]|uniref:Cytochrome P450 n=1 Tax=Mycobacterium senriense TaxID=2775496 RepID=A0ABN6IE97_9MYCO|nr:cytochrome P450 [Mycobacterium senriense]BCZ22055.1 cytochrome P450 [Mycobacterium senriense]